MRSRLLAAVGAVVLAGAGALIVAPSASANQIWYQAIGRPSADAPCPTNSADDTTAGWSEWTPSWEEWVNDGDGGYVCTRAITWAYEDDGTGGAGCVEADLIPEYVNFLSGWSLSYGAPYYGDPACSNYLGNTGYFLVYAPDGLAQAQQRCNAAFGTESAYNPWGLDVYACVLPG